MWTCSSKLPFADAAHGHRVVEVARGLAVDGDDGQAAVVLPVAQLAGRDDRLKLLRFLQHLDRKAMRQMVLADDDLDIDAEIVFVAEYLDHAAARILRGRRPIGDLHIDHQAFQVVPLAAAGLGAENAVAIELLLARLRSLISDGMRSSTTRLAKRTELACRCPADRSFSLGPFHAGGMMISCVTFSSIGVTKLLREP